MCGSEGHEWCPPHSTAYSSEQWQGKDSWEIIPDHLFFFFLFRIILKGLHDQIDSYKKVSAERGREHRQQRLK